MPYHDVSVDATVVRLVACHVSHQIAKPGEENVSLQCDLENECEQKLGAQEACRQWWKLVKSTPLCLLGGYPFGCSPWEDWDHLYS